MTNKIQGAKGGDARAPVESPNTLRSIAIARILDLISEGEIVGLVDGLKSVYLNETPLQNQDGSMNFTNVQVDLRYGTQAQDIIKGFPSVENEIAVGVELKDDTPVVRSASNLNLSAVRVRLSVLGLNQSDTETGDIKGHTVGYAIDVATDGGPYVEALTGAFTGKTMSKYERSHRIELPTATTTGWQIRVRRTTPNANVANIADITHVDSITEVIDVKMRYPNSALVAITIDASQFQNIPTRGYHMRGRIVRVPTNYDPETRLYSGIWDGTYKLAYTNNPAWAFLDLCTHERYGLGHIVDDAMINKWALYKIAQYCDELVPDGKGGMEPRFTCNLYLQTQQEAYKVLQDLATVFRGIAYWGNGEIHAVADMPEDPVYTYTPANVIGGNFSYQGSAGRTRHTVALVSWTDMNDMGRSKVEYIDNQEGIARFGIHQTDMTAIGCSSQGQAQRLGRYALLTAQYETDTVTFSVGLDGTLINPGKIIRIADPLRATKRLGGRITSATTTQITVDAAVEANVGDSITVIDSAGQAVTRPISAIDGTNRIITVNPGFAQAPVKESVWAIDRVDLETQRYRVLAVTEGEDGVSFTVTALRHVEGKFDAVDQNTLINLPPISLIDTRTVYPPGNVQITSNEVAWQVNTGTAVTVSWEYSSNAEAYLVEWRRDNGDWQTLPETKGTSIDIPNCWPGNYWARIKARNVAGVWSRTVLAGPYGLGDQFKKPGALLKAEDDIAEAILLAQNAQAAADGKIVSFWQPAPPVIGTGTGEAREGDIWFDIDDGNKVYRVVAGVWTEATDDDLAFAIDLASTAQSTADGKVTTYYQDGPPVGADYGDLWIEKDNGNRLWRWNGTAWINSDGKSVAKALSIVGGVVTIDCLENEQFNLTLTQNVTVEFINVPAATTCLITITMGGTGGYTIDFGSSVLPLTGQTYVPTATVGAINMVGLETTNGGAMWLLTAVKPVEAGGGGGAFASTVSPSPASDSVHSTGGASVAPSVQCTVTTQNGAAPVTHLWSRADTLGGTNFTISSTTAANPTFSIPTGTSPYSMTQTWRVKSTDNDGLTVTTLVDITLTRTADTAADVSLAPSPAYGFAATQYGVPATAQVTVTATRTGMVGPLVQNWAWVSGFSFDITFGASGNTCDFAHTNSFNDIRVGTYRHTTTDQGNNNATYIEDVQVTLEIADNR